MKSALDLRTLGMDPSPALEAAVRERVARLDHVCPGIASCRVTVESLHKHQHQGHPYEVRLDVTRPGLPPLQARAQSEDAHLAVRDAFDAMTRQATDAQARQRDTAQT